MNPYDHMEKMGVELPKFDASEKLSALSKGFDAKASSIQKGFEQFGTNMIRKFANWLGVEEAMLDSIRRDSLLDTVKQMYNGSEGKMGLKEISKWKVNKQNRYACLKSHAGFAAEVIGTAKENLYALIKGTGIKTFRADDRPDLFTKNDQYVDKIRVNALGEIVERIQVKFVGRDGESCLKKLVSKNYEKYLFDGKVDKLEIPQEFYDEIVNGNLIGKKIENLQNQIERALRDNKTDLAQSIEKLMKKYERVGEMLERSTVTQSEAMYAAKHPKRYTAKLLADDVVFTGREGTQKFAGADGMSMKSAYFAGATALAVSATDNIAAYMDGQITAQEMTVDIIRDTGATAALEYGTEWISTSVSQVMSHSSRALIKSLGNAGVPAMAVSFAVDSYDTIADYAQGVIDGKELAYSLGESASSVVAGFEGAKLGAAVGSALGPVGTAAGMLVGSVVGCALASEAYATAVEAGMAGAEVIAEQAEKLAKDALDLVEEHMPQKHEEVQAAFMAYFSENKLPVRL